MGILDKIIPSSLRRAIMGNEQVYAQGYKTFTEYAPRFSKWEGNLYSQEKIRAIVERIALACSKLKPEFVTPDGSNGSAPRLQRLVTSQPNTMMSWPTFLKRVATLYYVKTTAFVVPGYDEDGIITSLWPLNPYHAELIDLDGEPWLRFDLPNGEVCAYPFQDVVILTRFQMDSDVFGGGNEPLMATLRLMDAQRQAEENALQSSADIRFIGRVATTMHADDLQKKRDKFADDNLNPSVNTHGLLLYDQSIEDLKQIEPKHYVIDADEMARIDKTLYEYFGINEKILTNSYDEQEWAAFYEGCVEAFAIALASGMSARYLTPTQVRKGNHFMFSSGYLEYSTPDTKVKVVGQMMDRGVMRVNEARDVLQLPHVEGGDARMIRGEIYMIDDENNIIAESGGHSGYGVDHSVNSWHDDWHDEPDDDEQT